VTTATTPAETNTSAATNVATAQIELTRSNRRSTVHKTSLVRAMIGSLLLLALTIVGGLSFGAVGLSLRSVLATLLDAVGIHTKSALQGTDRSVLFQLRLPRIVLGGLVGAALSMAGASYQGVFRNPLADPYLLGAAAGAGVGATISFTYASSFQGWVVNPVPIAAFVGALFAVALSAAMAKAVGSQSHSGTTPSSVLLLSGVAVASFLTSVQTFIQQRRSDTLRLVYNWILGGLTTSGWSEVWLILPYLVIAAIVALLLARRVDVMAVGDDEAKSLGVSPTRVRVVIVLAATLATAAAVSVSGLIGFVGLIVPHAVRAIVGHAHGSVLIVSMILGAAFVMFADTVARTIIAPGELSLGIVTAFIGAPTFAFLLFRQHRGG
jgi:iron complex transport system permease protein